MKRMAIIISLVLTALLCGCAAWQLVETPQPWSYENFSAELPEGWMKFNSPNDLLFLTKDGELLQTIRFLRLKMDSDKELPISKKKFNKDMLLQEVSELIVNEMTLDNNRQNLSILQNVPAAIGTKEGFMLEYAFNTADKLKLKTIAYGFKDQKYVYLIQYQAAEQYYFEKDVDTFRKFIDGFKIL